MLGSMGRLSIFVLVFLLVAIAARVLFFDAGKRDDLDPLAAPQIAPVITPPLAPARPGVIDLDPDLDQAPDEPDCQGAPLEELPWEKPRNEPPL